MTGNFLMVGASRGIGRAVAQHFERRSKRIWCISRSPSPVGTWIKADLSKSEEIEAVISCLYGETIDALMYLGGTWEENAFTDAYVFDSSVRSEIETVIAVNMIAPIMLVHGLMPALRRSANPRCVFIGSLSGLENGASKEVANSASKYGLRGAAHALRLSVPAIPVTVINPGNVATEEVERDIAEGRFPDQRPIPMADLLSTIDYALSLSKDSVAMEVNLGQVQGA